MDKELIINSTATQVEIALIENTKLIEIHKEKTNSSFTVGDIFLGSVKKMRPSLNAAFVDLGHRKDAFLHFTDLGPKIKSLKKYTKLVMNKSINTHLLESFEQLPDNPKNGKIDQVFEKNDYVLVQILKEPISTKGPRLSCDITIPGRYVVLTPFSNTVSISKKIGNTTERTRLKLLVESIKPKDFGVVVRTAAEGKMVADLHIEIAGLTKKWKQIFDELENATAPKKLLSEISKTSSILRDVLSSNFNKIIINDQELYNNSKDYLKSIAPERLKILQHYTGSRPIFDAFGVTKQIKASFGTTYTMRSGAYLVLESTEAMHVIDVNSGPKANKRSQEDAALSVNLESAEEIARQLRLRDIGGLIIIDFIDMRSGEHKQSLFNKMKDFMHNDRAQHTILPLSKFGLMQITRQRVREQVKIDTSETCPTCLGTGIAKPSVLIIDDIVRDLEHLLEQSSKLKLVVHPFIYSYLKKGVPNIQFRWYMKYKKWIKITQNNDFQLLEYKFFDGMNDEIRFD
ncbi:MAG: Rne/Rng family ribonuclease [Saprospiraceae bacterium]